MVGRDRSGAAAWSGNWKGRGGTGALGGRQERQRRRILRAGGRTGIVGQVGGAGPKGEAMFGPPAEILGGVGREHKECWMLRPQGDSSN